MKQIRIFGLLALSALATMAIAGATSASAGSTLFCENNTLSLTPSLGECNSPQTIHFVSVNDKNEPARLILLSSLVNIECESLISGTRTSAALANPVVFNATVSYTNCIPCIVTVLKQGTILMLKTASELFNVLKHGFLIEKSCIFGLVKCDYDFSGPVGHGLSGSGGRAHITYQGNKINLVQSLGISSCPEGTFIDALYRSLASLYVRS